MQKRGVDLNFTATNRKYRFLRGMLLDLLRTPDMIHQLEDIAFRHHVALTTAEKIVSGVRGKLLFTSVRGPKGGYVAKKGLAETTCYCLAFELGLMDDVFQTTASLDECRIKDVLHATTLKDLLGDE